MSYDDGQQPRRSLIGSFELSAFGFGVPTSALLCPSPRHPLIILLDEYNDGRGTAIVDGVAPAVSLRRPRRRLSSPSVAAINRSGSGGGGGGGGGGFPGVSLES